MVYINFVLFLLLAQHYMLLYSTRCCHSINDVPIEERKKETKKKGGGKNKDENYYTVIRRVNSRSPF